MADVTGDFYAGSADIGYATELLVGQDDGSPETFAAVSNVISVDLGEFTANVFQKTHLRSPRRAHEKGTGLRDFGGIVVKVNWVPSHGSQSNAGGDGFAGGGLLALHVSQEERNFIARIGTEEPRLDWPFRGKVTGFKPPTIEAENPMQATYTIMPMGDYTEDLP